MEKASNINLFFFPWIRNLTVIRKQIKIQIRTKKYAKSIYIFYNTYFPSM